ncbi:DUF6226 family protein [Actinoplanes sp. NPDC051861]|uniref:DUF6226 family protein n=1 Tax=Actinoplanes sp. NPDC051861 TaxID=3155170 RepID=UPI00341EA461
MTVQERVEHHYAALGMPSWPNPHAGRDATDDEYSRVTDPARYRIVHARARAWAAALAELPGVRTDGDRVTSPRPGTLPLFLTEIDNEPAILQISVVRPDIVLDRLPDCGCDACDWGSADLLEAIDARVRAVVEGPFVHVRGDGWYAHWWPGGATVSNHHDFDLDLCRRLAAGENVALPDKSVAYVGRSWLALPGD